MWAPNLSRRLAHAINAGTQLDGPGDLLAAARLLRAEALRLDADRTKQSTLDDLSAEARKALRQLEQG